MTKVKLAAFSPATLTIGCEVRHKNLELPSTKKETIFFTAMDKETITKRLETLFNETNHNAMQNTPPKQENNTTIMAHKTENQPFLPQFYTTFRTTHEQIFYITIFGISCRFYICQNFEQHFRIEQHFKRFRTKCKAFFLPTYSL